MQELIQNLQKKNREEFDNLYGSFQLCDVIKKSDYDKLANYQDQLIADTVKATLEHYRNAIVNQGVNYDIFFKD